tara:strand:- start:3659 stop:3901 length:243 start_codon:yes stop_codon:yes gene_type:complete
MISIVSTNFNCIHNDNPERCPYGSKSLKDKKLIRYDEYFSDMDEKTLIQIYEVHCPKCLHTWDMKNITKQRKSVEYERKT